jgi:hypothetical protein
LGHTSVADESFGNAAGGVNPAKKGFSMGLTK